METQITQIDKNELNDLGNVKNNDLHHENNIDETKFNDEELKSILKEKPSNNFTDIKTKSLFNRMSSFFVSERTEEIKLEPNLNVEKEIINTENVNFNDPSSEKQIENLEKTSSETDLFSNEEKSNILSHQIDLIDIEQEVKDIDEKVLEIPAFLRRQAN